jgi:hypothetical protein
MFLQGKIGRLDYRLRQIMSAHEALQRSQQLPLLLGSVLEDDFQDGAFRQAQ